MKTPFELGYRMPAEWELHEATWLSWPKDPDTFPSGYIELVEEVYINIIEELKKGEKVNVLVNNSATEERVTSLLNDTKNVRFHRIKSVDVWIRDYGPVFVVNRRKNKIAATKWMFNAWGNKYDALKYDNKAGMEAAKTTGYEVFETDFVLEGGSIENNGKGTCITTEQCLLNKNRNPGLSKEQIQKKLKDYLGFTDFIWLKDGIEGDDTDGHVDDITRFVNEKIILTMVEPAKDDHNHKSLQGNLELLKKSGFDIVEMEMPGRIDAENRRLPASYANFYIGNACVLVPVFDDKSDDAALSIIKAFFPGRKVVGILCKELVYGYGGIHCITQQEPK